MPHSRTVQIAHSTKALQEGDKVTLVVTCHTETTAITIRYLSRLYAASLPSMNQLHVLIVKQYALCGENTVIAI